MPEGDTVWRAARALDRALTGRELLVTDFRVPALATADLVGAHVHETVSRGKHLLTRIVDGETSWTLHTHLRMEGSWHLVAPGSRWRRPAHQARVVLGVEAVSAVGFSLGVVELFPTAEEPGAVGHLGPDLLGPDWDLEEALRRLRHDPARTLHEALLDQTSLAGIGNMYAAEVCFVSGLDPTTPISRTRTLPRVVLRAKQMLELNKTRATQATTGDLREPMWVHGRAGRPCRRCGTRVETSQLGPPGRERTTFWCPACQPSR